MILYVVRADFKVLSRTRRSLPWEEDSHIGDGLFYFVLPFFVCVFCMLVFDVFGYREAFLCCICFAVNDSPYFRVSFLGKMLDVLELGTCSAAILLSCTDADAL